MPLPENLAAPDARLERLWTGARFTEGPAWNPEGKFLLFSDIPSSVIYRWTASGVGRFRSGTNNANGLAFDRDGLLLTCEHATSRLIRTLRDGSVEVLASHWQGKELNSPNDVVALRDGSIVFTDPPYGRREVYGIPRPQELGFQGVFRVRADGELELLLDDFEAPNGLCLSPDGTRLYVNDTARFHVRVFDWRDGAPQNGRVLHELDRPEGVEGKPDGMKCDARGNVWVTGPGGIWVVSPEGEHLGTLETPERAGNLAWGGDDLKTLFLCATSSLYRLHTLVAGVPGPMR